MPDWSAINAELQESAGLLVNDAAPQSVAGGDISAAWRLPTRNGDLFIKTGPASSADMFASEAEGLATIAASNTIDVPAVIAHGLAGRSSFLALEWLSFERANDGIEQQLGERLAAMHRVSEARYGWHRDNFIGLTPQANSWDEDWIAFFRTHRLEAQLRRAADNGHGGVLQQKGAQLLKRLPVFFADDALPASLLHGDLWGGNWRCSGGKPILFDPAVYYGDRETDLAMTRLFGGFGPAFYDAYEASWPLSAGHVERIKLYQLYHVLNHLNLFGAAYQSQALRLIDELLKL